MKKTLIKVIIKIFLAHHPRPLRYSSYFFFVTSPLPLFWKFYNTTPQMWSKEKKIFTMYIFTNFFFLEFGCEPCNIFFYDLNSFHSAEHLHILSRDLCPIQFLPSSLAKCPTRILSERIIFWSIIVLTACIYVCRLTF